MMQEHVKYEQEVNYGTTYDINIYNIQKICSKLVYVGLAQARPNDIYYQLHGRFVLRCQRYWLVSGYYGDQQAVPVCFHRPATFAAPPFPSTFAAPPFQSTFAAPPFQSTFTAPPLQSAFATLPLQSAFTASPLQSAFAASLLQSTFAAPPFQSTFPAAPPLQSAFATLPLQSAFAALPVQSAFTALPLQSAFAASPLQSAFASPFQSASPLQSAFVPPPICLPICLPVPSSRPASTLQSACLDPPVCLPRHSYLPDLNVSASPKKQRGMTLPASSLVQLTSPSQEPVSARTRGAVKRLSPTPHPWVKPSRSTQHTGTCSSVVQQRVGEWLGLFIQLDLPKTHERRCISAVC